MIAKIKEFQYNRRDVKAGILHIGVGNFHRAHEEFFTNHLLKDTDQQEWGIHGAMLLPSDERLYRALKNRKVNTHSPFAAATEKMKCIASDR